MKKHLIATALIGCSAFYFPSVYASSGCSIQQFGTDWDTMENGSTTDANFSTGIYKSRGNVCGHSVTVVEKLDSNIPDDTSDSVLNDFQRLMNGGSVSLGSHQTITVDGKEIWSGTSATLADFKKLLDTLGVIYVLDSMGSGGAMSSLKPSSKVGDIIQNRVINPSIQTRKQKEEQKEKKEQQVKQTGHNTNLFLADVKYERGEMRQTGDSGNIAGFTAGGSIDFDGGITLGAVLPYDYFDFHNFEAHRTGMVVYGKKTWDLANNFEFSTALHANYLYTATNMGYTGTYTPLSTFGGGYSMRLLHDNGGDFIPAASFAVQYNEDDKENNGNEKQYLVKMGPTLGYRVTDNAVVQFNGLWSKDVTQRPKNIDTDFFDVGIEGTYIISDTWQLRGGYKRMLGYEYYESDTFYLGNSLKF
jgi:hypothetical protein